MEPDRAESLPNQCYLLLPLLLMNRHLNGMVPLEPYRSQFQLAAWHCGWSDDETATHLALVLEGKALQVLLNLAPTEQRNLQAPTTTLERCSDGDPSATRAGSSLPAISTKKGRA